VLLAAGLFLLFYFIYHVGMVRAHIFRYIPLSPGRDEDGDAMAMIRWRSAADNSGGQETGEHVPRHPAHRFAQQCALAAGTCRMRVGVSIQLNSEAGW
jgi:hypothetical protein